MRYLNKPALSALSLLALTACGIDYGLSAEDELLITAISAENDVVSLRASDGGSGPIEPAGMGRECDAAGDFDALFAHYDSDRDEALNKGECNDVASDHQGADPQMRDDLFSVLTLVYDADDSGDLSVGERELLLEDFTVRCEVMAARLLEDFDADGDGELSDEEHAVARAAIESDHEVMHENVDGACGPPPEKEGKSSESASPDAERGDRPPSCFVDSLIAEFDLDADGELNADELASLRETVRDRILAGERFHGSPG